MLEYLIVRLLLVFPTVIGGTVLVFVLMRLVPGDVCENRLAGEGMMVSAGEIELCRAQFGLNDPMAQQLGRTLVNLLSLDFGRSMWTGRDITHALASRYELTLQLALMTVVVSVTIGVPLGILSAVKRNTWVDYGVRVFAVTGASIPNFWFGIMMIIALLNVTAWLYGEPSMTPIVFVSVWEDPAYNLAQLTLPAIVAGYSAAAILTRMTRSSMLEVLNEDYIRTARAKGLAERAVRKRHAMRNALLPVVTLIGLELAGLVGGLLVTEQLFNLNGIGNLFVESVDRKDLDMVQAMVLIVMFTFVMVNLFVDILYAWLDPRIRYTR